MVVDDQLRVIFANEAVLRMGHFERDEIQGHTPDAIFPSEDLPFVKQHESGHRYGPGFWVDCRQTLPWDCFTLARHPPSGPAAKPANRC
jgi:PAS domain-containing protein